MKLDDDNSDDAAARLSQFDHFEGVSDDEVSEEELEVQEARHNKALLEHIAVNSMGDYYQVPSLTILTNRKVRKIMRRVSMGPHFRSLFPSAIRATWKTTGNRHIQRTIATVTAHRLRPLLNVDEFKKLDVSPDFWIAVLERCIAGVDQLEVEIDRLRACLDRMMPGGKCGDCDNLHGNHLVIEKDSKGFHYVTCYLCGVEYHDHERPTRYWARLQKALMKL
jgi:hypothetical protein